MRWFFPYIFGYDPSTRKSPEDIPRKILVRNWWFDEEPTMFGGMTTESFPPGLSNVRLTWNCLGELFEMEMLAGFACYTHDKETRAVRPKNRLGGSRSGRRIYLAWSKDGRKWFARPTPVMDPPPGTDQVAGAVLVNWAGKQYLIAHANNDDSGHTLRQGRSMARSSVFCRGSSLPSGRYYAETAESWARA
jgi:hypothetical protein